jgi:hypothetical protein
LKSLLNFFVAKREKSGVALTMSLGKWETIAVKRQYRPRVIRPEPANETSSHCRLDVTIKLGNRVSKIGNSKIFALS